MSFYGSYFSYDGIPCTEYDLMIYDVNNTVQSGGGFSSSVTITEDRLARGYSSIFYGTSQNKPLTFTMVFGLINARAIEDKNLDRWDLEAVASWLTNANEYKDLVIEQDDMEMVKFKCIVTDLKIISWGNIPWAFSATIQCDSPFAYTFPETYTFSGGTTRNRIFSRSSFKGFYYPVMEIIRGGSGDIEIVNTSDNNRSFKLTNVPSGISRIYVDNQKGIIKDTVNGVNLYPYFNFNFLRLVRGDNYLNITGNGTVSIICEYPINVGG